MDQAFWAMQVFLGGGFLYEKNSFLSSLPCSPCYTAFVAVSEYRLHPKRLKIKIEIFPLISIFSAL
jgi:hypothetical protein